jgi:hypothetical protein
VTKATQPASVGVLFIPEIGGDKASRIAGSGRDALHPVAAEAPSTPATLCPVRFLFQLISSPAYMTAKNDTENYPLFFACSRVDSLYPVLADTTVRNLTRRILVHATTSGSRPASFRHLRKSVVSHLRNSGTSWHDIASAGGWADIKTVVTSYNVNSAHRIARARPANPRSAPLSYSSTP